MTEGGHRYQAAHTVLDRAVALDRYPRAVLGVSHGNGPAHVYGVPGDLGARHVFPLASLTKGIVTTAFMRLVERGEVVLREPVAAVWPEFGVNGKEAVTPWHLLTHTGGLHEDVRLVEVSSPGRLERADLTRVALGTHLDFPAGTRYRYGQFGFLLLGALIERLSGQPLGPFLQDELFGPPGMTDTGFVPTSPLTLPVEGEGWDDEQRAWFLRQEAPGGGLHSSARDLLLFGRALLGGPSPDGYRLLSPAALATMTRWHIRGAFGEPPGEVYSALGWGKRGDAGGFLASERAFGHGGATGSFLWVDPEYDLVVALLSNRWGGAPGVGPNVALAAINAVYGSL